MFNFFLEVTHGNFLKLKCNSNRRKVIPLSVEKLFPAHTNFSTAVVLTHNLKLSYLTVMLK